MAVSLLAGIAPHRILHWLDSELRKSNCQGSVGTPKNCALELRLPPLDGVVDNDIQQVLDMNGANSWAHAPSRTGR